MKSQIAAGLKREINDPDSVANRAFRRIAYAGHPYGAPVRGDLATHRLVVALAYRRFSRRQVSRATISRSPWSARSTRKRSAPISTMSSASCRRKPRCCRCPISFSPGQGRARSSISICRNRRSASAARALGATTRIISPRPWSITCSAAASSRRGSSTRCAKSAASPIRSIRSSRRMTMRLCSSAVPRPRTSARRNPCR